MKTLSKSLFWILYHIGALLFSTVVAMIMKYGQTGKVFVPETLVVIAIILATVCLTGYLAIYFVNKGAKLTPSKLRKVLVPWFLVFVAGVYAISIISVSLGVFVWFLIKGLDLNNYFPQLFQRELNFANNSLLMWLLFFSIVFFYVLWRKSSLKEDRLREENLKYKYKTLKSQVNPHFLFNSLNTLSELIYSDVKRADNYIQKLSGFYRYVLENEDNEFITLEKEIVFVQEYFELQKQRDNDKIFLKIDIQDIEKYEIIPVSLQLLIENALKHNSRSHENPLKVLITCSDNYIVVSNNIQRKNIMENSTRIGLQNLSERVKLIMNKDLIITEEQEEYIVKIPVIHKEK